MANAESVEMPGAIAVIAVAGRFPGARNVTQFWENLARGHESIRFFSRAELLAAGNSESLLENPNFVPAGFVLEDADCFDASFFGYTPRDAQITDPQQRLFLECAWEAIETAGYDLNRYDGRIGVFAGSGSNSSFLAQVVANSELLKSAGEYSLLLGNEKDFLASRVSYKLDLRGPSMTIQTACSTSLVAVHVACQSLLTGESDMALAGGVCLRAEQATGYLYQPGAIASRDGHCRPFDAAASGTVMGNGVGIVVLQRLEDALAEGSEILALILGTAVNNDGSEKVGFTAPSVKGQAVVIREALDVAGISAGTVSYVEAHGTGTALGDPVEIAALTQAFRTDTARHGFCGVGSLKANVGHLDAAAGVAGLIKVVLMLKHRQMPPLCGFQSSNPQIDFDGSPFYIPRKLLPWSVETGPLRAGVSALGIGGTNAHVVLQEPPVAARRETDPRSCQVLTVSAQSRRGLEAATKQFSQFLASRSQSNLTDLAYTCHVGRRAFRYRQAVVVEGQFEFDVSAQRWLPSGAVDEPQRVAFLFSGQQVWRADHLAEVYRQERRFREAVERCLSGLDASLVKDLRLVLEEGRETSSAANQVQLLGFIIQYALAEMWCDWGLQPSALLGYGEGEFAAACVAGVFDVEDAIRVVAARCALEQQLHSRSLLAERFEQVLSTVHLHPPRVPLLSGTTGVWLGAEEATRPAYWSRHLGEPTLFSGAIHELERAQTDWYLELGPGRAWYDLVNNRSRALRVLPSHESSTSASRQIQESLARLWTVGIDIDWKAYHRDFRGQRVSLPTYPFERGSYRIELPRCTRDNSSTVTSHADVPSPPPEITLPGHDRLANWFYVPSWKRSLSPRLLPRRSEQQIDAAWLIFADRFGLGESVSQRLTERSRDVVLVHQSNRFKRFSPVSYSIDPWCADHYDLLLEAVLSDRQLGTIAQFWNVGEPELPSERATPAEQLAFCSSLYLLQAAGRALSGRPIALFFGSTGARQVMGGDRVDPFKSLLDGPCLVGPQEYTSLSCRSIDLTPADCLAGWHAVSESVVAEMYAERPDSTVALRQGQIWIAGAEPLDLRGVPLQPDGVRKGGVYLITGAYGHLGSQLALHLAKEERAKLVLIQRPPQEELETTVMRERTAKHRSFLQRLHQLGADVLVQEADVADEAALSRVKAEVFGRFGAVNGIFHAAGTRPRGLIQSKTWADAQNVLRPKTYGTLALERVFCSQPLDLVVLFSSICSIAPVFGTCDYTAANAFLDAYATSGRIPNCLSISWDAWLNESDPQTRDERTAAFINAITGIAPTYGISALRRSLRLDVRHAIVTPQNLPDIIAHSRSIDLVAALDVAKTSAHSLGPAVARKDISTPLELPRNAIEEKLGGIWQRVLGISPIGIRENFFSLGGDSLTQIQLLTEVGKVFPITLSHAKLLDCRTLEEMARYVTEQLAMALEAAPSHSIQASAGTRRRELLPSCLKELQPGNGVATFFCIHPINGSTHNYQELARELGSEIRVIGIQAPGVDGSEGMADNLEQMVDIYAHAMGQVEGAAPYLIGGWSMGGMLAVEVARRLEQQGQTVGLVAILDTGWNSVVVPQSPEDYREHLAQYFVREFGAKIDISQDDLCHLDADAQLRLVYSRMEEMDCLPADFTFDHARESFARVTALQSALWRHVPQPYDGSIVLFRAVDDVKKSTTPDWYLGWDQLVSRTIDVRKIPGTHLSILRQPHVHSLAIDLKACILKAVAGAPPRELARSDNSRPNTSN